MCAGSFRRAVPSRRAFLLSIVVSPSNRRSLRHVAGAADRLRMQLSYAPARTYEESANQQTYPRLVSCGHRELAILWAGKRGATTRRATGAACPARLPRKRRKEGRGTCYNLFPRLSRGKVLHQTDGYLRLVFSAHRSIPAFPTPLRRVIGHHWPWYVARANGFCGNPMAWSGRISGADKAHMRVAPAPRGAVLPSHALRRDQSYGRAACR